MSSGVSRIVVLSHAGTNVGDNLLAAVLREQLQERFPDAELREFSVNPARLPAPGVTSLYPGERGWPRSLGRYVAALRSADLAVGFWAVQDLGSVRFALRNLLPRFAHFYALPRALGVPLALVNVDAVEVGTALGRRVARQVFADVPLAVCRNPESAASIARVLDEPRELPVTADIGLLFRAPQPRAAVVERGPIAINLRPLAGRDAALDATIAAVASAVDRLPAGRRVFVAMDAEDEPIFYRLAAAARHPLELVAARDPGAVFDLLRSARAAIAMRLHVQVLAALAGAPLFTVGYHAKNLDIARATAAEGSFAPVDDAPRVREGLDAFVTDVRAGAAAPSLAALTAARDRAARTFDHVERLARRLPVRG